MKVTINGQEVDIKHIEVMICAKTVEDLDVEFKKLDKIFVEEAEMTFSWCGDTFLSKNYGFVRSVSYDHVMND